jgi:hypothetical protein
MATIKDLPSTAGLFILGNAITLYDPKSDKVFGHIRISPTKNKATDFNFMNVVAAQKGFGPMMYEFGMMLSSPKGLMGARDGDIRGDAMNVWKQFYTNRPDVEKKTMEVCSRWFEFTLIAIDDIYECEERQEYWEELSPQEKEMLLMFNSAYYLKPDKTYTTLISRADKWIEKGIDQQDVYRKGDDFWDGMYASS